MSFKIVGGKSSPGQISILSEEFISTASWEPGKISWEVARHPVLSRFQYRHKYLPIPKLLKFLLFMVDTATGTLPRKTSSLIAIFVTLIFVFGIKMSLTETAPTSDSDTKIFLLVMLISVIGNGFFAFSLGRSIASWHGAEHMAISAFDRDGSVSLEAIAKESPVHDSCGGRLVLPLVAAMFLGGFVATYFDLPTAISILVALECTFWVDSLIGWDKIPGTSHFSRFLQRSVTTRQPGKIELLTAHIALRELVKAHEARSS